MSAAVSNSNIMPLKAAFGAMGAFTGVTLCWIVWGLATPGDFFAGGNPLVLVSLGLAGLAGAFAAMKATSSIARIGLSIAMLLGLLFWVAAPNGWWATPPPQMEVKKP